MRNRIYLTILCSLILISSGCGDDILGLPPGVGQPDSGPLVDAGAPDAVPIDAPPQWEPGDPVLPDDPCEIVSDIQEVSYDAPMANYSVRFKDGQGLEANPDLRQSGLLDAENGDIDKRDVIEKRLGADVLADTTEGGTVADALRRAIWARDSETILQTDTEIYSQKEVTNATTQWRSVGAWTEMRLREAYADSLTTEVSLVDAAKIGDALVVGYQSDPAVPQFAVYSPGMAQELLEPLAGQATPVRLSSPEDFVVATYQTSAAGNPLIARSWTPGSDTTSAYLSVFGTMAAADGVWDVHSAKMNNTGTPVTAWVAASPVPAEMQLRIRIGDSVLGSQSFAPLPGNIVETAVAVFPRQVPGGDVTTVRVVSLRAFNNAGAWTIANTWQDFDPSTGGVTFSTGTTNTVLADSASQVFSVALSFTDSENAYVAVEQNSVSTRKVSYYTLFRTGGLVNANIIHQSTSLATQGAIIAGTPSDIRIVDGGPPLTPAFVEMLLGGLAPAAVLDDRALSRNGWVMFSPRTREILARSFVGYTGNLSTRQVRPAKSSLITNGEMVTWGGPVSVLSEPAAALTSVAVCTIDRTQRPSEPAYMDGTAVSAHAGYPRAYDGVNPPFEHDWHSLPRIIAAPTPNVGAGFLPGTYFAAIQWEWDDGHGVRFRSAPAFSPAFTSAVAFSDFSLSTEPLTHTERSGVRVAVWVTAANGSTFHRVKDVAVNTAVTVQSINAAFLDIPNAASYSPSSEAIRAQEILDQGASPATQGIIPGDRARVTDFVSLAGGRLFSRDPLKGSLARFTIPSREASGFAMHWPLAFAVEEPDERDVTAVLEQESTIILGSELGLARLLSDGPDASGVGSFGEPAYMRAEIGIEDQTQLARTPIGHVYGSINGEPRLLSPGLTVEDIAKQVEREYKIDGSNIVSIAYDQNRSEMVFLADAGKTLRLNTNTGRWANDSNRLGRDLTVTKDGTLYLLRSDGKVLKQRQDVWADGGVGYALKVSTPWIRDMAKDGTTHSAFRLNGFYVSGEYLGPHDLFFDVYKDFDDVTPWGTFQVPEATVVANAAANRGWIYGVRLGGRDTFLAARIVVRDGAEPNRTFRLAQMDIDVQTNGSSAYAELPTTHYAARV